MGCDIHMYVEYRQTFASQRAQWERYRPGQEFVEDRPAPWFSFGSRINPGRDYGLFGLLAGVRAGSALIEPRGVPEDMSWVASSDYWCWIDYGESGDGVRPEKVAEWVRYGRKTKGSYKPSVLHDASGERIYGKEHEGKPTHVEHPDWHTPSWLTLAEFERALGQGCDIEYRALLAAMKELERGGQETRVIFWFDN
jgi:hypothetical protein